MGQKTALEEAVGLGSKGVRIEHKNSCAMISGKWIREVGVPRFVHPWIFSYRRISQRRCRWLSSVGFYYFCLTNLQNLVYPPSSFALSHAQIWQATSVFRDRRIAIWTWKCHYTLPMGKPQRKTWTLHACPYAYKYTKLVHR